MPTDELPTGDVITLLRDMRPDVAPAPDGWDTDQRARLLTFIETGAVVPPTTRRASTDVTTVGLHEPTPARRRPRTSVVLGLAAAAVLLVAGLVVAPRWRGEEPGLTDVPATVPARPAGVGVDRFPVATGVDDVTAFLVAENSASWPRRTSALLGRVDDSGTIRDAVVVETVDVHPCEDVECIVLDRVEVDGRAATVYEVAGGFDYQLRSLVIAGDGVEPTVAVTGADPAAFVAEAGGSPIRLLPVTVSGELDFDVERLPEGYEVVLEPTPYVRGAEWGGIRVGASPEKHVAAVVRPNSELFQLGRLGPIQPIDVGGVQGWTYDIGRGSPVIWQVSPTTWVSVAGAESQEAAIEFARNLRFTDRQTWEATYDVQPGIDELPATPITGETMGSIDQLDCDVIGSSPSNFDQRIEIDCGEADGVREGMPVVVAAGMVGSVSEIARTTSVVRLVTDPQFQAPVGVAVAAGSGSMTVNGVIAGSGVDEPVSVTVIEPQDAAAIEAGALVRSGEGGTAPQGVPIGRIIGGGADGSFDVELSADLTELAEVTVLLYVPEREDI